MDTRYCFSVSGILKWILLIFSSVVLGLICYEDVEEGGRGHSFLHSSGAETFSIIVASFTIAICALFLILFFLGCHGERGAMKGWQCVNVSFICFTILGLCWLAVGGIETWVAVDWRRDGRGNLFERRCAAAAFSFVNGIIALYQVHLVKHYGWP